MSRINQLAAARMLAAIAALALATPAAAQFGGLRIGGSGSKSSEATAEGCPKGKKKSAGSSIFGSVVGAVAGSAASRIGISSWVPIPAVAETLTNAIACKLDPEEQKQAAEATVAATRSEGEADVEVGQTSEWTSSTRENVKGRSTVVARNDDAKGGAKCITVSDVIIVNGEETTANKRMCRPPGSARYSLMA